MTTITVQIGNSDDKLTQKEWSDFVAETGKALITRTGLIHFHSCSHGGAQWQNAAWVATISSSPLGYLRGDLAALAKKFRQDSIALTVGDTEFLKP